MRSRRFCGCVMAAAIGWGAWTASDGQTAAAGVTGAPVSEKAQAVTAAPVATAALPATPVQPVSTVPQVFNSDALIERGRELVKKAEAGSGSAGEPIVTLKDFFLTLNGRSKPGGGELHRRWNDILMVLDGSCTEMTGGTMVEGKEGAGGEIRGTRLDGATPHRLRKGDFITIPAGTPHQQIVAVGETVVVLAVKVPAGAGSVAALSPENLGMVMRQGIGNRD